MYDDTVYVTRLTYQYLSRRTNNWETCEYWEVPLYRKYQYETRVINGGITKDYLL